VEKIRVQATEPMFGAAIGEITLRVHDKGQCGTDTCVIHNPSDHHMVGWPMNWRGDKGIMERLCPHGQGHPDPDDTYYHVYMGDYSTGVHGCDGCCKPPPPYPSEESA
jgi:hypothetical protein